MRDQIISAVEFVRKKIFVGAADGKHAKSLFERRIIRGKSEPARKEVSMF